MQPHVSILGSRGYPSFYGGFETLVRRLAPSLADRGVDVTVYGRPGATVDNYSDLDDRVHCITTAGFESKSFSTLSYGFTSTLSAARRRPHAALVLNVANGFWLPALRVRGVRTVVNVDGIEWERAKWGSAAKRTFLGGAKLTARFADEIVCDSVAIGDRWRRDFGRSSTFIPYGADVASRYDPPPHFEPKSYVLLVARFVPENSVPQFFRIASRLAERFNVVLVGSSGYGGELDIEAERLSDHPRITWMGHVADDRVLHSLWHHCAAYFHGHTVGGTNPALVQAMACGAPVVARDTVFNREVLGPQAAYFSDDPSDMLEAVLRVASSTEVQRGLSSRLSERAVAEYGWEGVCNAYHTALMEGVDG